MLKRVLPSCCVSEIPGKIQLAAIGSKVQDLIGL